MEPKKERNPDSRKPMSITDDAEYREAIKNKLSNEIKITMDLEMQKAAQELMEERKNAIKDVVEEYQTLIHQIVEEEKAEIWKKAETLKKSMLQLGL
jgi:cell division protein FtsI/penicillin-binding protein 2